MAKNLNDVLAALPSERRAKVEQRAGELATLKDLRLAVAHTQQDLAASLGVGQDAISRIERRSDLLLSTLRRYIQAMGGELELVARFPNRPPVMLDHVAQEPAAKRRADSIKRTSAHHKVAAPQIPAD
jgi:transcriptional regulator with XRE-family HTH domain